MSTHSELLGMVIRSCNTPSVLSPTLVAVTCMQAGDMILVEITEQTWLFEEWRRRMNLYMLNISISYLARLQEMFNNYSVLIYIHMFISAYSLCGISGISLFFKRLLKLTDHNCFTLLHRIKSYGFYSGKTYINFHSWATGIYGPSCSGE